MNQNETIRLYLLFPCIGQCQEIRLPACKSLQDCIPFLNELLNDRFADRYQLEAETIFLEAQTGTQISRTVTLSRQNLQDGMRLIVY